jgi:hypothetical protein
MNRASTQLVNRLFKAPQIDRVAKASAGSKENSYAAR